MGTTGSCSYDIHTLCFPGLGSMMEVTFATTLSQPCSQFSGYLSKLFEGKKVWEGLQGNLTLTLMDLLEALGRGGRRARKQRP